MFQQPYYAMVAIFAGNFAPRPWAFCQGQLMSIAQNTALFALIGTIYGGDGQTTFALPNLAGRAAIHIGQGPGLSNYFIGESGGSEAVTLLAANLPAHNHAFQSATGTPGASSTPGTTDLPANNYPATVNGSSNAYSTSPSAATLGVSNVNVVTGMSGNSIPIDTLPPYLAMNYVIALEGIFPSRN